MKIIIILMQKTRFNRESFAVSLGVLKVRVCLFQLGYVVVVFVVVFYKGN